MTGALATAALRYAVELGLGVLPLRPGTKLPATAHGVKDASTEPDQIATWWSAQPHANVGIAAGGLARLLVLDFDAPEALATLTDRYGERPATWTATTPRGGRHEFYVLPTDIDLGNSVGRLAQHVDTRGSGGYVVAAPSMLEHGRGYAWVRGRFPVDLERAALPSALLEALAPAATPEHDRRLRRPPNARAHEGDRFDPVRTLDALRYLDADDFETWRDVGLALKASGHPAARGVWDAWAAQSAKYDAAEQERQWRAMKPRAITTASIFFHAKNAGWRPMEWAA